MLVLLLLFKKAAAFYNVFFVQDALYYYYYTKFYYSYTLYILLLACKLQYIYISFLSRLRLRFLARAQTKLELTNEMLHKLLQFI